MGSSITLSDKISLGSILSGNISRSNFEPFIETLKTRQQFFKKTEMIVTTLAPGTAYWVGNEIGNVLDKKIKNYKKTNAGKLQKEVEKGKAPRTIDRIDKGRGIHEKDHVHFEDGSAINSDGSWKHGGKQLTNDEMRWLLKNGWDIPTNK